MKRLAMAVCLSFALGFFAAAAGYAQGNPPPPPCCPRSPGWTPDDNGLSSTAAEAEFVISAEVLQALGLSRSQFVDRLAVSLFPGKEVHLVFALRQVQVVPNSGVESGSTSAGNADLRLISIEETWHYRVPYGPASVKQVEKFDQVWLTDGTVTVRVAFAEPAAARPSPPVRGDRTP